ncbi:MAG TPA: hypothetical protein VLW55_25540 [Burkholderiaceae bacterium]|nr:hypothetical protein [Burkholderiaceae bacterium]
MRFSTIATIAIYVTAIFGVAFLFLPEKTSALYGLSGWNTGTIFIARLFGVALLFLGAIAAAVRHITDADLQRRLSKYLALANLLGVVVSAHAVLTGAGNALLWSIVAIYLFFTLAWGSIVSRR